MIDFFWGGGVELILLGGEVGRLSWVGFWMEGWGWGMMGFKGGGDGKVGKVGIVKEVVLGGLGGEGEELGVSGMKGRRCREVAFVEDAVNKFLFLWAELIFRSRNESSFNLAYNMNRDTKKMRSLGVFQRQTNCSWTDFVIMIE